MYAPSDQLWTQLLGHEVVLDLAAHRDYLELEQVDAHDLRDTQTTREKYVLECRLHGIRPNRGRAWISLREIVSISRLADVLID
jgi:hypothetical protein